MASAATLGIARFNRQTFIGGGYEMINRSTFEPNPDYFAALLWSKLVGTAALHVQQFSPPSFSTPLAVVDDVLRAYAFCSGETGGISATSHSRQTGDGDVVIIALNFSPTAIVNVSLPQSSLTTSAGPPVATQRRVWYVRSALAGYGVPAGQALLASSVALKTGNGSWDVLRLHGDGSSSPSLPLLQGVTENRHAFLSLQPQSYAFAVLEGLAPQACSSTLAGGTASPRGFTSK